MSILNKILCVEDEPNIRAVIKLALKVGGFTTEICSSGAEALAAAPLFLPELILLDVMMPQMDGPATLLALHEISALQETPAIFMTAKVQADEIAQYEKLGVLGVIAKPFDPMTLPDQIRNLWVKRSGIS